MKKKKINITDKQRKNRERSLANLKKFPKGVSGNPKGRPTEASIFNNELKAVEKKKKKTLYQHACERAFVNDKVLIAILNKKLPDLNELSGKDGEAISVNVTGVDIKKFPKKR